MYESILTIFKNKQHYAKVVLARELSIAVKQAKDFAVRFPADEGFQLKLYQFDAVGRQIDFQN